MPRILFVGYNDALLRVLANIFAARGSPVCVSTEAEHARVALSEFSPHIVLWDAEPADCSLDPAELGFEGPTLVLAHHLNPGRNHIPHRKVLLKPVSADDIVEAVLESGW